MLITVTAHNLMPVGEADIAECIRACTRDLNEHIESLLLDGQEPGLQNYRIFDHKFGKKITFNNKNIVFNTLETGKKYLDDEEISICCNEQSSPKKNKLIGKEINDFFGRGEFPYRNFFVIRIGSQEYFFYVITR